jgi:signal peptidase
MALRKLLKAISTMTTVLLFVVLCFTIFFVIVSKASGGETNLFGYQLKTVLSGSMEPKIQTGSVIAIKLVDNPSHFEKGDVITFKTKDHLLVTHRIYKVKGQQYVTKGDNNNAPDPDPVLADHIVGEYTGFTVLYAGYAMNFAGSKEGSALMLILPGLFLIGYAAFTIWRAFQQIGELSEKKSSPDTK